MAAVRGQVNVYGRAVELLTQFAEDYDFGISAIRVSLHSSAYTPNTSHAFPSDLTGEVSGGNYSRKLLQGREVLYDEATGRFQFMAARVTWPRSTLAVRYAVIRFDQVGYNPNLLAWVDFGQTVRTTNALLEIVWNNGLIFELEGAD